MLFLEILAILGTIFCVYLTAKQNIWSWPVSIVGLISFFIIFVDQNLPIQASVQVIFIIISVFGWILWYKSFKIKHFDIKKQQNVLFFTIITLTIVLGVVLGHLLYLYGGSNIPYMDGISSTMAILATYYQAKKYIETWVVWMGFNLLLCYMMVIQESYLIAILEIILFIISYNAYKTWKRDLKTDCV